MKILHVAQTRTPALGIYHQMLQEQAAAIALGIPWTSCLYSTCEETSPINVRIENTTNRYLSSKFSYYKWLSKEANKYDLVLLRYLGGDALQWLFLKHCKTQVMTVHHTLEVPEIEANDDIRSKAKAHLEKKIAPRQFTLGKGIVAVTQEILDYECSRASNKIENKFIYPNGIEYPDDFSLQDQRGDVIPEILFVANHFSPWHGLDLLIRSTQTSRVPFKLHLIGEITQDQRESIGLDRRYIIHGRRTIAEISALVPRCWIGLSSFALYRKKMTQACTLKVREYLRYGIPVYSGHRDVFDNQVEFYRCGECDIDSIIQFAHKVRSLSRKEVSEKARTYIDKSILLKRLYAEFQNKLIVGA
jgi:glycosyltransferase involved in cell wall biosynthesis